MRVFYTASATATSGRQGRIVAENPPLDLQLSSPKEMGGPGGEGTNPEQLFAAGYAACFGSAVALVARTQGVDVGEFSITGHVGIGKGEGGAFGLQVELVGRFPALSQEEAESIMEAAHAVCPYSNAIRGNVEVRLSAAP